MPRSVAALACRGDDVRSRRVASSVPSCAYLVEDRFGVPVGYAAALPTVFKPIYELQVVIGESAPGRHAGDALLMQIIEDLQAQSAISLQYTTSARRTSLVAFLTSRGFDIVERAQDWRLGRATANQIEARTSGHAGYEFQSLETLLDDRALFDAALELVTDVFADDPVAQMFLPIHPETLRRLVRAQRQGLIAIQAGTIHGLIAESSDDVVPNGCRINLVLVRRDRRRQGLATALLGRLLSQTESAPVRFIAPTDIGLACWLTHSGFVKTGEMLRLERLLRKTVHVTRERLDDYAGRYVVEALPMAPITIERHGDMLVSKARDMRDVLLAASDCEFFTRHHDGRGRFERNDAGQVARLVFVDGPREFVAVKQLVSKC